MTQMQRRIFFAVLKTGVVAGAVLSFLEPLLNAVSAAQNVRIVAYGVLVISCGVVYYFVGPPLAQKQPPAKGVFQGVGKISAANAWLRRNESEPLLTALTNTSAKPIFLVGNSGVGKSVLVETQIIPRMQNDGWSVIATADYDTIDAQLLAQLEQVLPDLDRNRFLADGEICTGHPSRVLFVCDQLEHLITLRDARSDSPLRTIQWFTSFLQRSQGNAAVRNLLVIRKEFYYDLRILGRTCPAPTDAFHLSGLRLTDPATKRLLELKIGASTGNHSVSGVVLQSLSREDEVMPIEAQIVGLMLENKRKERLSIDSTYYARELGGKEGLIEAYFETYLDAAPDRRIAERVLFALSIERAMKRQLTHIQIADIIHDSETAVVTCLRFFESEGLICEANQGSYELAHDYLAERFHDLSGSELEAVERDNIFFFWREARRTEGRLPITRYDSSKQSVVFSDYFLGFLILFLSTRLISPVFGARWNWLHHLGVLIPPVGQIDILYAPIFTAHLCWSVYVTLLYRRFFGNLSEPILAKLLSKLTVVNCTLCVLAAAFLPHIWVLSIGIGGLVVGVKFLSLSRTPALARQSRTFFRDKGRLTIINGAMVSVCGAALFHFVAQGAFTSGWLTATFAIAGVFLTWFMIAVAPKHITADATSQMRGLIDRRRGRSSE